MTLACALVLGAGTLLAQEHRTETNFQSGGDVRMDLGVGDYEIVPGSADKIVVSWKGRRADEAHARVDVSGKHATVHTDSPKQGNNDVHFRIEMPRRTDVSGHISVGDVTCGPFTGNADVGLGVGDLTVYVSDPQAYGEVSASTHVGDVTAGPFGGSQESRLLVGQTLHWTGKGDYRLKLQVGTGDLKIEQKGAAQTM